ncbi:hypothetical protein OSB04_003266 [Centaurea solstitialis]|uniref:non-specific serine/threonine protein kinase n=1 Tax=Centaurea solstitialis TaxID=347529 RepID=A0AA38TUJ1_9ASTR|nr:hypothetical protein OSB04_003266 [Centaurea solstitialis]
MLLNIRLIYYFMRFAVTDLIASGGAKEPYRSSSIKKPSYPLPPPPQHIYPQKLPTPRHETEMILVSPHLKSFTFNELSNATRNFFPNYLLGEGGFGCVYKGWLDRETLTPVEPRYGIAVAIKKLKPDGFQGHKEWLSEITYLGKLQHPNLVNLFGFCCEGKNRLLVYEFMPRGSLENHLFKRGAQPLSWALRVKIAVDAARGLSFLHASESKIIYRDFKSSNILLNLDYSAKLSDFGLAKAGPTGDLTHVSTRVMGTEGYTAPEYMATGWRGFNPACCKKGQRPYRPLLRYPALDGLRVGSGASPWVGLRVGSWARGISRCPYGSGYPRNVCRLTTKCDVYSFGIVLLEIITGRRAIDWKQVSEEQKLLEWVRPQLQDPKKLFRIMDTKLEGRYPRKGAYVVANLALQCCHPQAKYRPHMPEILSILERVPCGRQDHHQSRMASPTWSESNGNSPYNMSQTHGSQLPQWSPQGSPLPQWSPQGSPLPQWSPQGSPLPQWTPQGSPLPQWTPQGSPLPQWTPQGSPLPQWTPQGSPLMPPRS